MPDTYNLLLVGRAGNGKSSTGNTILDKSDFTIHGANDNSSNEIIEKHRGEKDGKHILVFESSGIGDNGEGGIGDLSLFASIEQEVFTDQHISLTAIILVLKFGVRFTRQEKESVDHVKFLFGDDVFRNCGVIVMTYGDNFNKDQGEPFTKWCENQSGDFKQLLEECDGRCVLFNNRDHQNKDQVIELWRVIESSRLQRYTQDHFKWIRQERLLKIFQRLIQSGTDNLTKIRGLKKKKRKVAAMKTMLDLVQRHHDLQGSTIPEAQKKTLLTDFGLLIKATEMETHRHKGKIKFLRLTNKDYKYRSEEWLRLKLEKIDQKKNKNDKKQTKNSEGGKGRNRKNEY